ncbi:MAG: cell division protein FtsZ [Rickettsia endosymbiont of Argas persicus]
MVLNIKAPENIILKPRITVFGVGGAGSNAVNNMISANLQGANFVVANTDAQSLEHSFCENKIQLGVSTTRGLGAGASPEIGALAAQESENDIRSYLENSNMVFITAGMGGGTGTGSAPVIARIAKELGILTVGVVTKPFHFEGGHRMKTADKGLIELQQFVDTLIVIPNQNLFRIANEQTTFADAFKMADDVLHAGVRGVTDLMIMPGLINLDFADIKAVMSEMGKAMMGTGEASGEDRAIKAAESAISNPLLDHSSMCGARGVLINITGGSDMTLFEVDSAANRIREEVDNSEANIIFGSTFNPELKGIIRVSVVATGIDADKVPLYKLANSGTTDLPNQEDEDINLKTQSTQADQTFHIEEIPNFNSYSSEKAEIIDSLNQNSNFTENKQELEVTTQKDGETPKSSFFIRMWETLKSSNNPTQERKNIVVGTPELDQDAKESDIHDVPAFLRKKRD